MFGLITGSGFYDVPALAERATVEVDTPFGGPVAVTTGSWDGVPIGFIPRHGRDHSIPPHAINYRANVAALASIGADCILATAVSGGISPAMTPGTLVLISDYLDFTHGRAATFFDGSGRPVVAGRALSDPVSHTDMSAPYDRRLRAAVLTAAAAEGIDIVDGGVYCTTNGPRFETPAEIRMMRTLGGDLVGMTGYPEVALAVEADLPYASIGVVSNPAAGISSQPVSSADIGTLITSVADPLYRLIGRTVATVGERGLDG